MKMTPPSDTHSRYLCSSPYSYTIKDLATLTENFSLRVKADSDWFHSHFFYLRLILVLYKRDRSRRRMLQVRTNYSCSCLWLDSCNLIMVFCILKILQEISYRV